MRSETKRRIRVWFCIGLALLAAAGRSAVAEDAAAGPAGGGDEQTQRLKQILEGLRANEARIKNLTVKANLLRTWSDRDENGRNLETRSSLTSTVDQAGRAREEGTAQIIYRRNTPKQAIREGRIRNIFDGQSALMLLGPTDKENVWFGQYEDKMQWAGLDPWELTTHYEGQPISTYLENSNSTVAGTELYDLFRVTIVETLPIEKENLRLKTRFFIDERSGFTVVERRGGRELSSIRCVVRHAHDEAARSGRSCAANLSARQHRSGRAVLLPRQRRRQVLLQPWRRFGRLESESAVGRRRFQAGRARRGRQDSGTSPAVRPVRGVGQLVLRACDLSLSGELLPAAPVFR